MTRAWLPVAALLALAAPLAAAPEGPLALHPDNPHYFSFRGKPTVLGNQLLEFGNAANSSCITCHAMAGIDKDGQGYCAQVFRTGLPQTKDFGDKEMLRLQTDFLYSIPCRAHSIRERGDGAR